MVQVYAISCCTKDRSLCCGTFTSFTFSLWLITLCYQNCQPSDNPCSNTPLVHQSKSCTSLYVFSCLFFPVCFFLSVFLWHYSHVCLFRYQEKGEFIKEFENMGTHELRKKLEATGVSARHKTRGMLISELLDKGIFFLLCTNKYWC